MSELFSHISTFEVKGESLHVVNVLTVAVARGGRTVGEVSLSKNLYVRRKLYMPFKLSGACIYNHEKK